MNDAQDVSHQTINTDVVIVEADPTGLVLACQFSRYGLNFVMIDQREGITPYSKVLEVPQRSDVLCKLVTAGLIRFNPCHNGRCCRVFCSLW